MLGPLRSAVALICLVSRAVAVPVKQAVSSCDQEPDPGTTLAAHGGAANGSTVAKTGARAAAPPPCPVACYCPPDHPGAVYCDGRELHDAPRIPEQARFVYLQNNEIEALSECETRDAGRLLGLNLDGNVLTSPALARLALRPLRHLLQLHLERNQLTEVPLGLPASLESLHLAFNRIALVPEGAFARMPRLRSLDLRANRLQELRRDAFSGLSVLQHLNLAGNRLRAMPPKPPSRFLYQLILNDNAIESIAEDYLGSFPRLVLLDLGKNALGARRDGGRVDGSPSATANGSASTGARRNESVIGGGGGGEGGDVCVGDTPGGNGNASDVADEARKAIAVMTDAGNSSSCKDKARSGAAGGGSGNEPPRGFSERTFLSHSLVTLRLSANHLEHVPAFHNNLVQLHLDENDIEDVNVTAICRPQGGEPPRLSYFRLDKNPIMESPQAPIALGKIMHCFPYLQPML